MDEPHTQIITLPSLTLEQAGILADDAAADSLQGVRPFSASAHEE